MAGGSRSRKKAQNISGLKNQKYKPSPKPEEVKLVDEDDNYGPNCKPYTERLGLNSSQEDVDNDVDGGYIDGTLTAEIFTKEFEEELVRMAAKLDDPLSDDEWLPTKERANIERRKKEKKGVLGLLS